VIPTFGRQEKLLKCLGSINQAIDYAPYYIYVYVYYSDKNEYNRDSDGYSIYNWILPRLLDKPYKASEFWNDHLQQTNADIFIYLNDDIVLEISTLERIVNIMNTHYQDLDGIVAIVQENIPEDQVCKTAFGAIGSKFINRFKNKRVFCEDYDRFFLDKELEEYATKNNKLFYSTNKEEAPLLIHHHPAFSSYSMDSTHYDVRKYLAKDKNTYNKRKSKNLLWGESYKLINK